MNFLCEYKDALGKPNEGVHSVRLGGFAAFDIFVTMVASLLIYAITNKNPIIILILLFIIGQICHYIFCVDTAFMNLIRGN